MHKALDESREKFVCARAARGEREGSLSCGCVVECRWTTPREKVFFFAKKFFFVLGSLESLYQGRQIVRTKFGLSPRGAAPGDPKVEAYLLSIGEIELANFLHAGGSYCGLLQEVFSKGYLKYFLNETLKTNFFNL